MDKARDGSAGADEDVTFSASDHEDMHDALDSLDEQARVGNVQGVKDEAENVRRKLGPRKQQKAAAQPQGSAQGAQAGHSQAQAARSK